MQKFWKAAVAQDWAAAHAVLCQWTPGTYRTRRNAEADYLALLAARDERRQADPGVDTVGSMLMATAAEPTTSTQSRHRPCIGATLFGLARKFWNIS